MSTDSNRIVWSRRKMLLLGFIFLFAFWGGLTVIHTYHVTNIDTNANKLISEKLGSEWQKADKGDIVLFSQPGKETGIFLLLGTQVRYQKVGVLILKKSPGNAYLATNRESIWITSDYSKDKRISLIKKNTDDYLHYWNIFKKKSS